MYQIKFIKANYNNVLGEITGIDEFKNQKRGGSGVKVMAMTSKTGKLISAKILTEEDRKSTDLILISKGGQTIRE